MLTWISTFTYDTKPLLPIIYYFCLAALPLSWCNNDDDDDDNDGNYTGDDDEDDDDDKDDDDDDGDNDGKDADSGIVT